MKFEPNMGAVLMPPIARLVGRRATMSVRAIVGVPVVLGLATIAAVIAQQTRHPVTAALFLMMGIIVNGAGGGLAAGLVTAGCAAFFYNFFIRFPIFEFGLDSIDDYVPFVAFTVAAGVCGILSGRLKDRAQAAEQASLQLDVLLAFSARLQHAIKLQDIVDALRLAVSETTVREHILPHLEQRHAALLGPQWRSAIARPRAAAGPDAQTDAAALQPNDVDLEAVADLLAMAIERCELLDQRAEAEAIRRSEELKTALLSSLSHDLRTPIAAIAAAASSLNRYGEQFDARTRVEMFDTIETQCQRLDRFTAKLLSLGQLQSGAAPGDMEIVDIVEPLGSAIGQVRALQPARAINKDISAGSALVWANPAMLEQVFFNILENAISYTPEQAPITVRVATVGERLEIGITDEGGGISAQELPYIFDRFFRSAGSRGKSGQGLGLSIAKGFVEAFGGTICAVSPPRGAVTGTQIRISLPLASSAEGGALHG